MSDKFGCGGERGGEGSPSPLPVYQRTPADRLDHPAERWEEGRGEERGAVFSSGGGSATSAPIRESDRGLDVTRCN